MICNTIVNVNELNDQGTSIYVRCVETEPFNLTRADINHGTFGTCISSQFVVVLVNHILSL